MIDTITITEQADCDLRGIYEYIAFELLSPENAAGQLERLEKSIAGLEEFPEKFVCYENGAWRDRGLRIMPVDNFRVCYILNKEACTITIIRVLYVGRDIDEQLKNYL